MGRRGPPKKPTARQKLEGNPGKRKRNAAEPKPEAARTLDPPDWLTEEAQAEFRRLAPLLARVGLLTDVDLLALASYCQAYGLFLQCNDALMRSGTTSLIENQNGSYPVSAPEFNQAMKCLQQMKAWGAELGLTPAARAGLQVKTEKPADKLAQFIRPR